MFEYLLDGHKVIKIATEKRITLDNSTVINIFKNHGYTLTNEYYKRIINGREDVSECILVEIAKLLGCNFMDIVVTDDINYYGNYNPDVVTKLTDSFAIPKNKSIQNQTWGNGDRETQNMYIGNGKFTKKFK